MKYTVKEVLQFIEGNDVRFIRLVFFDISGRRKNLLIPASELKPAFEKGVPVSADAAGSGSGEILLFPEPDTLRMQDRLIRQGTAASLLCTLRCCDGAPFEGDVRRLLKNACERFRSSGLGAYISLSGDFTLLRRDNDGSPTGVYNDSAGYYDSYPDDRGENVIRQICLSLDETDIVPLKPVMSLVSHISYVKNIEAGDEVSYGGTFKAEKTMRVATIPVGYADGYPRMLSGKGYVLIKGRKAPILGRVCMDQFMVDVTDIEGVTRGDEVVLLGKQGDERITAEELGDISGRFNYELVCDISKRVPRNFIYEGRIIEQSECI